MIQLAGGRLQIRPSFFLGLALMLVWDDGSGLPVLLLVAGICHELGHLLAAWQLGFQVRRLRLSFFGAELDLPGRACRPWYEEAVLLAAGPAVNLLLAGLCCALPAKGFSLFGAVNLLLGCFNLLPVLPLDGGGLLEAVSLRLLPGGWGLAFTDCVGSITRGLLLGLGVFFAVNGNLSLLLLALWLLLGSP